MRLSAQRLSLTKSRLIVGEQNEWGNSWAPCAILALSGFRAETTR